MFCVEKCRKAASFTWKQAVVPPEFQSGIVPRLCVDKQFGDELTNLTIQFPHPNLGSLNNLIVLYQHLCHAQIKCMFCPPAVLTHLRQSQEDCSLLTLPRKLLEFCW